MFLTEKVTSGQYGIQGLPGSVEDTVWVTAKDVANDTAMIGLRKDELKKLILNLVDVFEETYQESLD